MLTAAEEIEPALRDHWEDATTSMHADDAQHLYVDVAELLARRASLSLTAAGEDDEAPSAPPAPSRLPQRQRGRACRLEKLVRSGYRTVRRLRQPR